MLGVLAVDEVGVGELNDGGEAALGVLGEEPAELAPVGESAAAAAVSAADAAPDQTPRTSGVSGPGQAARHSGQ